MNNYQGGLQLDTRDQNEISGVSKNPGVLWLSGEDRNKLAVIAITLEHVLKRQGYPVSLLDQDQINTGLCSNLGESDLDRIEYIRRVSETCKILDEIGLVTIVLVDVKKDSEWELIAEHLRFPKYSVAYIESNELWQPEGKTELFDKKSDIDEVGARTISIPPNPQLYVQSDNIRVEDVINSLLDHLDQRDSLNEGYIPLGGRVAETSVQTREGETPIAVAAG